MLFAGFDWVYIFPALIAVALITIFSFDKLILLITFLVPFSITINDIGEGLGMGMNFPSEPLTFALMVAAWIKYFYDGNFDRKILMHPLSIAILIYLGWIFITSLFSTRVGVSLKFFVNKLWIITVFYFLATQLFRKLQNIQRFIWCYAIPLFGIIIYALIEHASFGFTQKSAYWVMKPFYIDHGVYAATIAFFVPFLVGLFLYSSKFNISNVGRFFILIFLIEFLVGIVFSFTRATWVSLVAAGGFMFVFLLRIRFFPFVFMALLAGGILYTFQTEIKIFLTSNKQDSANNFSQHVKSIYNVSTDDSNLERINRWNSAFRMWKEKPIMGWGPGVYKFEYARYQLSSEKTKISTNFGTGGNSHSEYVGPLCETGIIGLGTFILVIALMLYRGMKLYYESKNSQVRLLCVTLLLGLITYFVHGVLNNYSDSDKVGTLIWGFTAAIVAMDVYHHPKGAEDQIETK